MVNNIDHNPDGTLDTTAGVVELASLVGSCFYPANFRNRLKEEWHQSGEYSTALRTIKNQVANTLDSTSNEVCELENPVNTQDLACQKESQTKEECHQSGEYSTKNQVANILFKKRREAWMNFVGANQKERKFKTAAAMYAMYVKGGGGEGVVPNLSTEESYDLEAFLECGIKTGTLERIEELYSDPNVRKLYLQELEHRKDNFEMLDDGKKGLVKVLKIEETIKKAKKFILGLRIESFVTHETLTPAQVAKIQQIQSLIAKEENKKAELLQSRETATAHRLGDLKRYRKDLENKGFITFPSRQKIIDEIIEKLVMGENVLLSGPTGTGKTLLAIKALESLNIVYSDISGKTLSDEIKAYHSEKKEKSGVVDEFAMILSGHSGITASEFIAKPALKGQIETTTELGTLLKAFVEGKVPIIDEIDLIPNDVLMRVKHLFTLKPGSEYAPQEDGNKRYTLNSTGIIATANIKSEKHHREELDPAIVRLFKGVQVPYLTTDETYDLALANLMEKEGFIYALDKESLGKDNILYNLVKALKEIEDSYLGKGTGSDINIGGSDKSGIYLQRAILEIGNFASMFKGFKESGVGFKHFIKTKIAEFVSNGAYPVNDILLLIRIFSQNSLIIKSDISLLEERIVEISRDQLEKNIMGAQDSFNDGGIKFIDPYELSNLDPYEIRKLSELSLSNKTKKQKKFFQGLLHKYIRDEGHQDWGDSVHISARLLREIQKDPDFVASEDDINTLGNFLLAQKDFDSLAEYSTLGGTWSDKYNSIKSNNPEAFVATGNSDVSEVVGENLDCLIAFINHRRSKVLKEYGMTQKVTSNWAQLQVFFSTEDSENIDILKVDDVEIIGVHNTLTTKGEETNKGEETKIYNTLIGGTTFQSIQVPKWLERMKFQDTFIGKQLAGNSILESVILEKTIKDLMDPDGDFETLYAVYGKTNMKDNNGDNICISLYDYSADTDAVRECMKLGFNTSNIVYDAILGELIMRYLGGKYVNYSTYNISAETEKRYLEKIEKVFGIHFIHGFNQEGGVFQHRDGSIQVFSRGGHDQGVICGPLSIDYNSLDNRQYAQFPFRASV